MTVAEHYKAKIARLAVQRLSREFEEYLARTEATIETRAASGESDTHKLALVRPSKPDVPLGATYREAMGKLCALEEEDKATRDPEA